MKVQGMIKQGPYGWCTTAIRFLVGIWTFLMLAVFPFYMENRYSKLGVGKFRFFLAVSVICLLPAGILQIVRLMADWKKSGWQKFAGKPGGLDRAMLLYLAAVFLSWAFSVDRKQAWTGMTGWSMGLRSQCIFVLIYFLVSRHFSWKKILFAAHFLASAVVFGLGIGHRFMIDPLHMYEGISEANQLMFLSTIGQASWYSSYVCTVLVIGVTVFFLSKKPLLRLVMGAYCMLGFGTVVTQNSDSAFAAMAFLLFVLFLTACDSMDKMERFFEVLLLMFGSFRIIGVLQEVFSDRAMRLGGLSEFLSKSIQTWLLFLIICLSYMAFLLFRQKYPGQTKLRSGRLLRRLAVAVVLAVLVLYIVLVWANTTGYLKEWTGYASSNQYLLFDRYWGNSRGFTWKFTGNTFTDFPAVRKLFGVGPDCFSVYCYADSELGAQLDHYFGRNQMLINAHNEFLNAAFCMGLAGLAAYVLIFAAAFGRFFGRRREAPLVLMGALAVPVYAAHNFFCYQQACCTPFLFLILGMAENLMRNGQKTAEDYLT